MMAGSRQGCGSGSRSIRHMGRLLQAGGGQGSGDSGRRGRSGHGVISSSGRRRPSSPAGATGFDPNGRPSMSIPARSRRHVTWM